MRRMLFIIILSDEEIGKLIKKRHSQFNGFRCCWFQDQSKTIFHPQATDSDRMCILNRQVNDSPCLRLFSCPRLPSNACWLDCGFSHRYGCLMQGGLWCPKLSHNRRSNWGRYHADRTGQTSDPDVLCSVFNDYGNPSALPTSFSTDYASYLLNNVRELTAPTHVTRLKEKEILPRAMTKSKATTIIFNFSNALTHRIFDPSFTAVPFQTYPFLELLLLLQTSVKLVTRRVVN